MRSWTWPLSAPPFFPDEPGQFGAERVEDVHTGIDLYCELGTEVRSVEDGEVVAIEWFTGEHVPTANGVPSTWWHNTKIILVKGASGVVGYGECSPIDGLRVGSVVKAGEVVAVVDTAVLKSFKGRPMVMLHLEMYQELEAQADDSHTVWWPLGAEKPSNLLNPTFYLLDAAAKGDPGYTPPRFRMEDYAGVTNRDPNAPCKASKWWSMWGGDWENPPAPLKVTDAAVVVIFNRGGRVLLLERHGLDREYPGGWCFPGGKIEVGETASQAAEREAFEETGLIVKCTDQIAVRRSVSPRGRHFRVTIFKALRLPSQLVNFPTPEHRGFTWHILGRPIPPLAGEVTRWVLEYLEKA